ncbi:MAG: hypothetical protein OXC80_09645 [Gammaproteobacteria bacterium]|nr:hypothetical protein [Gammaproteobacteria bacterium]
MTKSQQNLLMIAISFLAIMVALLVVYLLVGIGFIIPLLENLQADRLVTGNTPSVWEASVVFLVAVLYMGILTVAVIAGGLSGWVVTHLMNSGGFSIQGIRELFRVELPE